MNHAAVSTRRTARILASGLTPLLLLVACTSSPSKTSEPTIANGIANGIHRIEHVVVIMQENRSFDSYFGTYPGADGFPRNSAGGIAVCVHDPRGSCVKLFHDPADVNRGGPHSHYVAKLDVDHGKMDGFVASAEIKAKSCVGNTDPVCSGGSARNVMGYHDAREIPNYWRYAHD